MAETKGIPHTLGLSELMSASSCGLLLFKKADSETENGFHYTCTLSNDISANLTGRTNLNGEYWTKIFGLESVVSPSSLATQTSDIYFEVSDRWCQAANRPVDELHFLCTITDITVRKNLELEKSQLADLLNEAEGTMKFGSWMGHGPNNDKRDEWWSAGLYDLLGYTPGEAESLVPSEDVYFTHVHPDDRDNLKNAVEKSFDKRTSFEAEYRITTKKGEEKFVVSRGMYRAANKLRPGTSYGNAFDMTPIRKIRTELEQKVKELNRSNFDLEQFAYVASHDLQEPLRKIVSFGERLETKSQSTLNDESALYLNRILSASRRMQDMINNLLEFSKVARTREGFVPTDLESVMKTVLSDLEIVAHNKGAQVRVDPLPKIEAIPSQIAQLFQNLLTNSLKFTRENATPLITVEAETIAPAEQLNYGLPANRRYLRLLFSDNGIGFSNQDASRIFTIFQRLRGRSEYEGAGIGLSVCKKVVENHSGIIMASAKPDEGAQFTILLPFENP